MSEFIERQKPVIERTGLGLLPGITLALILSLGLIAAIVTDNMLVVLLVVVGILTVTGTVLAVIMQLLGDEEEIYSHDD
jgi:hypothetical protein